MSNDTKHTPGPWDIHDASGAEVPHFAIEADPDMRPEVGRVERQRLSNHARTYSVTWPLLNVLGALTGIVVRRQVVARDEASAILLAMRSKWTRADLTGTIYVKDSLATARELRKTG